jgi:hypothetical protein
LKNKKKSLKKSLLVISIYSLSSLSLSLLGDIDHFEKNKDFTYDPVRFAGLPQFVDQFRSQGFRFIPIVDPALVTESNYMPYIRGQVNVINKINKIFRLWMNFIQFCHFHLFHLFIFLFFI